jgi:HEAT repeat protein
MQEKGEPMMLRSIFVVAVVVALAVLAPGDSYAADAAPAAGEQVDKAIAVLRSAATLEEKFAACRRLAAIGDERAVPVLAGLLGDEKLSHMARYALEPIPHPSVDDALRGALGKVKGGLLVGVIGSIGARGDAKAVGPLVKLAGGDDGEVAKAAVAALGRIAAPEAVAALARLRAKAPDALRLAVADASLVAAGQLLRRGRQEDAAAIYRELRGPRWPKHVRLGAFGRLLEAQPGQAAASIVQALAGKDRALRAAAIAGIATIKGAGAGERFAAEMPNLPPGAQVLLIGALARRGGAAARPAALPAAVKALGVVGDAACIEVLCKALAGGKTDEEKAAAAASLRGLKASGVDAAIARRMKAAAPGARAELIAVLADRKATGAVGELVAQARGRDAGVRAAALKALGLLGGPKDLPALVELLVGLEGDAGRSDAERAVLLVSRKIENEPARADAALAALKATSAVPARCSLLRVLGGVGGEAAFQAVEAARKDADPAVRDAAVRALAAWPDVRALPALRALFHKTDSKAHRALALRGCVRLLGLGTMPGRETVETFAELAGSVRAAQDKKLVLAGLAGLADPAALKVVEPLLADSQVRGEAELALLTIARAIQGSAREQARAAAKKLAVEAGSARLRRQAAALVAQIEKFGDHVTAWQVSGPYPTKGQSVRDVFAEPFAPEKPGAKGVKWRTLPPSKGDRPWMFDLHVVLGGNARACYVRTWVHSAARRRARLEFGDDDGSKVWLNGKLVFSDPTGGAAAPGEHKVAVELRPGWNPLMLKVAQISGPWQFCLRVTGPDGRRLEDLRTSPRPPED